MPFAGLVALIAGAVLIGLLLVVHFTQTDRGLRIEATAPVADAMRMPGVPKSPPAPVLSTQEVRTHLLDRANADSALVDAEVTEALLYCDECLRVGDTLRVDERTFQIMTLTSPGTDAVFAAAVLSEEEGAPRLHLVVSGQDLSLTPGRGGTLVAQESRFTAADEACCPSGWSVQVYRFHDGRFEAGQRVSSTGER